MSTRYQAKKNARRYNKRTARYSRKEPPATPILPIFFLLLLGIGAFVYFNANARSKVKEFVASNNFTNKVATEVMSRLDTFRGKEEKEEEMLVYATPATQANITKILAYTLGEGNIPKDGTSMGTMWYSKYYEVLQKQGRDNLLVEADALLPISYAETSSLLRGLLGDSFQISLYASNLDQTASITLKEFLRGYEQALTYIEGAKTLKYETLNILATPTTNTSLPAWTVATNKGQYGFEGLILDPFKDCTVKALVVDKEILAITETISKDSVLPKATVRKVEQGNVWMQIEDTVVSYEHNNLFKEEDVGLTYMVAIREGKITNAESATGGVVALDEDSDIVLRVGEDYVELMKAGRVPYQQAVVVDTSGTGNWSSMAQVAVGSKVSYLLEGSQLVELSVLEKNVLENIRVVITSDGLMTYLHENVQIKAVDDFYLQVGEAQTLVEAGTTWDAEDYFWREAEKLTIVPTKQTGLQLVSIERRGKNPVYKGSLDIYKEPSGGYIVINEVDMTSYIAGVVPSEMPPQYGLEAAKVQAVAARSYAISHQNSSKFAKYGAQLDDTTASQVYNNVEPTEMAYEAAIETENLVMVVNDKVISGNFFSTSAGYTANYGETWADGELFPTNTPTYLISTKQHEGEAMDISREADAYTFLTMKPEEVDAYDNHSPWFRWQLKLSGKELTSIINANIGKLSSQYPNIVKVAGKDGSWKSENISSIGTVKELQVKKRGEGGNIMELVVTGTEATVKVATEYVIRSLLSPTQKIQGEDPIVLTRTNGSDVENMAMLPSAFFVMDANYREDGTIQNIHIQGGGFGHGVGMSQEGVKGMVDRGLSFEEILENFYTDVAIKSYPF